MTISVGYGSSTFEFKSKYPNLHMPSMPVSDAALVTPGNAAQLLDGEFVVIDTAGEIARPAGTSTSTEQLGCYVSHGNPGRSDLQVGQHVPVVMDEAYEFVTRLHSGSEDVLVPTPVVANKLYHVAIGDVKIDGVVYTNRSYLKESVERTAPSADADGDYYVARCIEAPSTVNGWARFITIKGLLA
ncbi:MAG: hypothetical protein ACYS22_20995 [Planctomycetota bacterium]|jgi:hypothetical protein